jgi:flap endonuclease-1
MGLQISEIVPKQEILFEDLKGKVIAVDAFNTLYQFLTTIRQPDGMPLTDKKGNITSHLSGLFYRTTNLMTKGLKLVFVFDGKAPELKARTHEKRREVKEQAQAMFETAETIAERAKYASRISYLNEDMIDESKKLLDALGIPVVQAPSEGEAQAAFMARRKDVYAAASQDYDSLAFGAPKLVRNLTLAKKRKLPSGLAVSIQPEMIELEKVLNVLQINLDQLICLGILTGTDYNPGGVKGLGPKKSLQIVRQHKTPVQIFKSVESQLHEQGNELGFDWSKIFELFKKPDVTSKYEIKFKEINEEKLKKILVKDHDFSEERVDSAIKKVIEGKEDMKQANLKKFF